MNCRQAIRLLPLWIGRDLADAAEAEELRAHLMECCGCSAQQRQLQSSLDVLQSISTTSVATESGEARPSLWPRLALVLKESPRRRDQFNGWIPALAMTLAASLMVAVSVVQIRREMGESTESSWNQNSSSPGERNLFQTDRRFASGVGSDREVQVPGLVGNRAPNF